MGPGSCFRRRGRGGSTAEGHGRGRGQGSGRGFRGRGQPWAKREGGEGKTYSEQKEEELRQQQQDTMDPCVPDPTLLHRTHTISHRLSHTPSLTLSACAGRELEELLSRLDRLVSMAEVWPLSCHRHTLFLHRLAAPGGRSSGQALWL
jgi:hypothetical protein